MGEGIVDGVALATLHVDDAGGVADVDHAEVLPVGVGVEHGGVAEGRARQGILGRAC